MNLNVHCLSSEGVTVMKAVITVPSAIIRDDIFTLYQVLHATLIMSPSGVMPRTAQM